MPGSASQDDRRISLEGELTDEIKIDTSLIPEHVRMHLAAKTLECFKAFLAVPGNAEWLDEQVATMKAAELQQFERSDEDGILPDLPLLRQ